VALKVGARMLFLTWQGPKERIQYAKSTTREWADRRPPRTAVKMRPNGGGAEWRAATPLGSIRARAPSVQLPGAMGPFRIFSTALASGRGIVPMRRTSAPRRGGARRAAPLVYRGAARPRSGSTGRAVFWRV